MLPIILATGRDGAIIGIRIAMGVGLFALVAHIVG